MYETTDPIEPADDAPVLLPPPVPLAPPEPLPDLRRQDRFFVAALVLLATLFFADVLLGIGNFYMRDLTRYYYPAKSILREIAYGGEFPYWNRYFSGGQPIAANPEHEVFYPLTWLILLPSYDFGYRLHILVHIYIGLLGMYALLRSMALRPFAAFYGALTWGLGGLYLSYVNLLPILFCAAWLPLTCLFVRRFLLRPNKRDFALAALFLGTQFLIGEPTTVMQTGFLIGMYSMYRGVKDGGWRIADRGELVATVDIAEKPTPPSAIRHLPSAGFAMARNVGWIALISICAIAVGAAQMIPAIDHVGDSARSRTFGFDLVSAWSLPWAKLAEVIYPNILGHIAIDRVMWYWGGGLYPGMGSPFLFSIYGGLLMIALVVAGTFSRPRGGIFLLIVCAFSLLIALGGHTPLLKWLYDIGIATAIRYPEKFILIAVFSLTIFAAQMLDRILGGDDGLRDAALGFVLATTLVAATIGVLGFTPVYAKTFMKIWGLTKGAAATKMIVLSRADWLIAAARGAILFTLLWFVRTPRRNAWMAAVAIFVCVDLGLVVHELNPRMPARFFTQAPEATKQFPEKRKHFRVFHEADWYGQEATARQYFSTGEAVYWIVRGGLFPMTPAGHRLPMVLERDYDKTELIPTIDLTDSVWDLKRAGRSDWYRPYMAMSNAWYRATYTPFEPEKKRVKGNFRNALPITFLEGEHYPRYYFADRLVTIKDRHDMVKKLSAERHTDRTAFVTRPSFVPAGGTVSRWRESANHARIEVESRGRAFLVMSVTPHKYWTVTIDGKTVTPIVTNIGYQGIEVPRGKHLVEMHYRNTLVQLGGSITVTAAVLLLALATLSRRKAIAEAE